MKKKVSNALQHLTPAEVHAFAIGVYHGVAETRRIPEEVRTGNKDVKKEIHYAKGGFVVGVLLKWSFLILIGKTLI